jgi:hypothetical protein
VDAGQQDHGDVLHRSISELRASEVVPDKLIATVEKHCEPQSR